MQAQLRLFLLSLTVVVCLIGVGIWYLGPSLLNLAFFAEGRSDPYLVLDFRQSAPGYETVIAPEEDWRATFSGHWHLTHVLEGRVADEWPILTLSTYKEAGDVVQFVTSAGYRDLKDQSPDFDHHLLGSFASLNGDPNPVLVVWLAEEAKAERSSLTGFIADLPKSGSVVWQGEVSSVQSSDLRLSPWDHGVIVGFNTLEDAVAYATAESIQVERAVVRSRVESLFLAIYVNAATD